jgi:23S rRNA pseudouridine955/2504/2580 synthase
MRPEEAGAEIVAGPDDAGRRLDKVLRSVLPRLGLSEIYGSLRKGAITVNGARADPGLRLAEGDRIGISGAALARGAGAPPTAVPDAPGRGAGLESARDLIVAETEHLLFVNKPRGMLSHGPRSVEERMRAALAARSAASLSFSPGPLHRLDRNTSGLMAFPATAAGARAFASLQRERRIRKLYVALLDGLLEGPSEWRDRITRDEEARRSAVSPEGDEAMALAAPLLSSGGRTLALIELRTGLTHQIRVQASSRGLPLSGDSKYGGSALRGGYVLHALALEFPEPPFPDVPPRVVAPLPAEAAASFGALFGRGAAEGAVERAVGGALGL